MKNISDQLKNIRSNIRPEEATLVSILSQIPELSPKEAVKQEKRRPLLSPYVAYAFATLAGVYALFLIYIPIYQNYEAYRIDNDLEFQAMDENANQVESGMNNLEDQMLMLQ